MPSNDVLLARLFLLRVAEPPAPAVRGYVAVHGPVTAAEHIRTGAAPHAVYADVTNTDPPLSDDLRVLEAGTARLITPEDDDWPDRPLGGLDCVDVPLALWVRGQALLKETLDRAVTITGSRACTSGGASAAERLGRSLAENGATVVSGGSFGIDEAAHRGALSVGGQTLVVVGHGLSRTRADRASLYQAVMEIGGLVVSEYPIDAGPTRHRLQARARLLGAFSVATVIPECGLRSGALAVARRAHALGRHVYCSPSQDDSATSRGVDELLRTGVALPLSTTERILLDSEDDERR